MQEDVTPERVVEIVEKLRRGEKPAVWAANIVLYFFILFFLTSFVMLWQSHYISVLYFSMAHKIHEELSVDQKEGTLHC